MFNIKQKLKDCWNWIKDKCKKFWHWFLLILVGTAMAAGVANQSQTTPSIQVEGQTISFPYLDNNSNEDMIIRTNNAYYSDIFGKSVDVYVMVDNKSGKAQISDLQFYFPKQEITVNKIYKMTSGSYEETVNDYGTTTGSTTEEIVKIRTGSHKETKTGNIWQEEGITSFNQEHNASLLAKGKLSEKSKQNQRADKKTQTAILKNGVAYYKVNISLRKGLGVNEFYIEAVGDRGGYGLLDPTIMTENFNSYSNGDLNGQGSWSGSVTLDVQGTTVYEGAKAVVAAGFGSDSKTGTTLTNGTTTIYIRPHAHASWDTDSYAGVVITLNGAADPSLHIYFHQNGNWYITNWVAIGTYTDDTWHKMMIEWRNTPDYKYRVTMDDGTPTAWVGAWNGGGNWTSGLNEITLEYGGVFANGMYWDCIGLDNCTTLAAETTIPMSQVIE